VSALEFGVRLLRLTCHAAGGPAQPEVRWTPIVRQPEPLLKV
jgi:hypothetical protein